MAGGRERAEKRLAEKLRAQGPLPALAAEPRGLRRRFARADLKRVTKAAEG